MVLKLWGFRNFIMSFTPLIRYTKKNKKWHSYLINTIEMRSLWMEMKYIKSTARLLNRDWVNKGGLDLSKEVLWVSVGQLATKLQAVKVWEWSYHPGIEPGPHSCGSRWAARQNFFQISNFDSLQFCGSLFYHTLKIYRNYKWNQWM